MTHSNRATTPIYFLMTGFRSFLFWTAFITGSIYYIKAVGLSPLQLVLVGTVLELATFLCEIPTGVIAGIYGRKRSVLIGFVLQDTVPSFAAILVAQVFYGSGWAFISGAEDAWLADEIGNAALSLTYLRGRQVGLAASFIGILASVALASIALNYPFLSSGLGLLCLGQASPS